MALRNYNEEDGKPRSSYTLLYTIIDRQIYVILGWNPHYSNYGLFGGGQKKRETPIECASREFFEETRGIFTNKNGLTDILHDSVKFRKTIIRTFGKKDLKVVVSMFFLELRFTKKVSWAYLQEHLNNLFENSTHKKVPINMEYSELLIYPLDLYIDLINKKDPIIFKDTYKLLGNRDLFKDIINNNCYIEF